MTTLPVQRKCDFQANCLGLKITRLMALAYTLPSYTAAESSCKIRIVGDILDSLAKSKMNNLQVPFWCDYSLQFQLECVTSRILSDLQVVVMINLQMMIFGLTEYHGYKGYIQLNSRKKYLMILFLKQPLQRISGKREDADTLRQGSYW